MSQKIKIGTRESQLAVWQAKFVQNALLQIGLESELTLIKSDGELNLVQPLYEIGVQGIFTKTLDIALLNKEIDIAVHSLKDVPTRLPEGLTLAAVPMRGNTADVLVCKNPTDLPTQQSDYVVATSSLRRKAQWLNRYPHHTFDVLRGNINSRVNKLKESPTWKGALFAAAGIERIALEVPHLEVLDWMLPAPAQGALGIACRSDNFQLVEACAQLNHEDSMLATYAERQFLRTLEGGCTMPIAALAIFKGDTLYFKGNVLTIDGTQKAEIEMVFTRSQATDAGRLAAEQILQKGGKNIINTYQSRINKV